MNLRTLMGQLPSVMIVQIIIMPVYSCLIYGTLMRTMMSNVIIPVAAQRGNL